MRRIATLGLKLAVAGREITKGQWRNIKRTYGRQPRNVKDFKSAVQTVVRR